jgi:hypothetical protein
MAYVIRWRLRGRTYHSRETYAVPADAIDFASAILPQNPLEIWIEGPEGVRIERDAISRASRDRASPPRTARPLPGRPARVS